jgi:tRNA(Ile)-lysidine synthase
MVMLHLFNGLKESWNLQLSIVHVNHHLRGGESDQDEQFVADAASECNLPFFPMHVDVPSYQAAHRVSKQEAARELRYQAFETAKLKAAAELVATAHHADDNAETVLMNALRGAGIRGLSGIPLRREKGSVIRPLLFVTREEISRYAELKGIRYREDSSNVSTVYARNALRRVVIPELEALTRTSVVESLNRVSSIMRSLQERVQSELNNRMPSIVAHESDRVTVSLDAFLREPMYLQEEMMLEIFRSLGIEPSARKVQSCLDLCKRSSGRFLQLASQWRLYRERDKLIFSAPPRDEGFEYRIEMGKEYSFPQFRFGSTEINAVPEYFEDSGAVEYIDADKVGSSFILRNWKRGDWFLPLGMESKKKLSDFFTNEKVPLLAKRSTPILESEGSIVWVCGLRLDQRFRITPTTKHVVKLEYSLSIPQ